VLIVERLLRRLERVESLLGIALAVEAAFLSISPPVTPAAQLIALIGTALFAAAFVIVQLSKQDIAARVAEEHKEWLQRQFASIRNAQASAARQTLPRIRLDFAWEEGEQKDKPIIVRNAGGSEALHIEIRPIVYGECVITFDPIPPLAPDKTHAAKPDIECKDTGPLLTPQNLIEFLEKGLRSEELRLREEGKAGRRPPTSWMDDLDFLVRVAMKARVESKIEVIVTYENEKKNKLATVYSLEFTMWSHVTRIALNWIEDR
jgi:hypothetical protein